MDGFDARLDEVLVHLREMIADRGHIVVPVGDSLMHTVGFAGSGRPELVLTAPPFLAPMLEEIGAWCAESPENHVTVPAWTWRLPPWRCRPGEMMEHTFATRWYDLAHEPQGPLGFVLALYGNRARAIYIDILSCPCDACAEKVLIDSEGNTRPCSG